MTDSQQEIKCDQNLPITGEVPEGRRGSVVLFPGSFNPFTKGHADIVERGLALFDQVIVAVGYNAQKAPAPVPSGFAGGDSAQKAPSTSTVPSGSAGGSSPAEIEARLDAIRVLYRDEPRVRVMAYSCLTADAARQQGACAILRSVRSVKDYEYELQMADVNRQLTGIDTIVLFARPQLASISSSVVRELQQFGHDITPFLP